MEDHHVITRVIQQKRPRMTALLLIGGGAVAAGLFAAVALATIPPPPADTGCTPVAPNVLVDSVEVPNKNTSAQCITGDGVIVDYIGSSSDNQSSGTGLFDPFVRLQGSPTQQGYNTDGNLESPPFDTKAGQWTHAILVSAIPTVDCDGSGSGTALCWELFVDINESNNAKHVSLNKVEIYFSSSTAVPTNANLVTGYPFTTPNPAGTTTTLKYAFDGVIKIHDVNQGSGRGDLRFLVPLTNIPTPSAGTYFLLYSQWGTTSATYNSEGGFEEWKVRKAPNVSILKTANPVGPVSAGTDIGFDITVSNTGAADATNVTITDTLPAGTNLSWSLSPAFPGCTISGSAPQTLSCTFATLAAGASIGPIHIQSPTTQADCAVVSNTATVAVSGVPAGSSTASVTVECAAITILKQSTKTGNPLVASAGAEFCYRTTIDCSTTNVTDNGTGDQDTAVGSVCVSGLAPGTYRVNETSAPTGYGAASQANLSAVAVNGTNCTTNLPTGTAVVAFTNPPLGEIGVTFTDLGSGETAASIVCKQGTTTIDAETENGAPDTLTISSNSAGDPTVVTTSTDHGLTTGTKVNIAGSNSDPLIDGLFTVTRLSDTTFSIPVAVTTAGSAGTITPYDDTDETFTDLPPGTYDCQVVIDP